MNKNKGFTLIELLVVISVIGLLSSIILASLNNARQKAKDQRLISDMVNLRTAAEIFFTSNKVYYTAGAATTVSCANTLTFFGQLTSNDSGGVNIMLDIKALTGYSASNLTPLNCSTGKSSYAIRAALPSTLTGTMQYICIDNTGTTKQQGSNSGANGDGVSVPFTCLP